MTTEKERPGMVWYSGAWRTPQGAENKRIQQMNRKRRLDRTKDNERRRDLYHKNKLEDPNFMENNRVRDRLLYQKNKKKILKQCYEKRKKIQKQINKKQREKYARNKKHIARRVNDGRRKRDPTIGLFTAIQAVKRGERKLSDVVEQFSTALSRLSEGDESE